MSLYAEYVHEREGFDTFETAIGFATYKKLDADTYYLRDIFVAWDRRRQGVAKELSAEVARIAKAGGANKLLGSVCLSAKDPTQSIAALLADGFVYSAYMGNMLYFTKKL